MKLRKVLQQLPKGTEDRLLCLIARGSQGQAIVACQDPGALGESLRALIDSVIEEPRLPEILRAAAQRFADEVTAQAQAELAKEPPQ